MFNSAKYFHFYGDTHYIFTSIISTASSLFKYLQFSPLSLHIIRLM